jgi:hypothetical protein
MASLIRIWSLSPGYQLSRKQFTALPG